MQLYRHFVRVRPLSSWHAAHADIACAALSSLCALDCSSRGKVLIVILLGKPLVILRVLDRSRCSAVPVLGWLPQILA